MARQVESGGYSTREVNRILGNFFGYLADPSTAIDTDRVAELEAQISHPDIDVLERVRLRQQFLDAKEPQGDWIEDEFVALLKSGWPRANGLTVDAFKAEQVPDRVLRAAGLLKERGGKKATTTKRTRQYDREGSGRVRAAITKRKAGEVFTAASLADTLGVQKSTAANVVRAMAKEGAIESAGEVERAPGARGRAPVGYRLVSKQS